MVQSFNSHNIKHLMAVFKIGIFGSYQNSHKDFLEKLKIYQRERGFSSTFLVKDYANFKKPREKSFYFVRNSQVQFFENSLVGKGGYLIEMEEYTRNVQPLFGKTGYIVINSAKDDFKLEDELTAILDIGSFDIIRYSTKNQACKRILGQIYADFYEKYIKKVLYTDAEHTLLCELCGDNESEFICINRCENDCKRYHFCSRCFHRDLKGCEHYDNFLQLKPKTRAYHTRDRHVRTLADQL